jgi:hypothetical protein
MAAMPYLSNAKGLFWASVHSWRFFILFVLCEASVGGLGTFYANNANHSAKAQALFTVVAIAGAAALALALTFVALWVTGPRRIIEADVGGLRDEVAALAGKVDALTEKVDQIGVTPQERIQRIRIAFQSLTSWSRRVDGGHGFRGWERLTVLPGLKPSAAA